MRRRFPGCILADLAHTRAAPSPRPLGSRRRSAGRRKRRVRAGARRRRTDNDSGVNVMATFLRTVESFVQGARTMPQRYYVGDEVFALEQDRIFARSWLCVGRSSELTEPGAY